MRPNPNLAATHTAGRLPYAFRSYALHHLGSPRARSVMALLDHFMMPYVPDPPAPATGESANEESAHEDEEPIPATPNVTVNVQVPGSSAENQAAFERWSQGNEPRDPDEWLTPSTRMKDLTMSSTPESAYGSPSGSPQGPEPPLTLNGAITLELVSCNNYSTLWTKFVDLQYGPTYVTKGDDVIMKELGAVLDKLEKLGFTVYNFTQFNAGHPEAAHLMWTLHKMAGRDSDSAQSTKPHLGRQKPKPLNLINVHVTFHTCS
ncbi:hypothetical protein HDE_04391 [Halotydeus destructor]|nr:hypothetical protein HDE_04391 [Halotydeus destructor]